MYVRWVVRHHKNATIAPMVFHDAYLVESYRDDDGRPRQRTLVYLGNIRELCAEFPPIERELFLLRAESIMQSLATLSSDDCTAVLHMLHQKVTPLTPAEATRAFVENVRWYCQHWQQRGHSLTADEVLHMLHASGLPGSADTPPSEPPSRT